MCMSKSNCNISTEAGKLESTGRPWDDGGRKGTNQKANLNKIETIQSQIHHIIWF